MTYDAMKRELAARGFEIYRPIVAEERNVVVLEREGAWNAWKRTAA